VLNLEFYQSGEPPPRDAAFTRFNLTQWSGDILEHAAANESTAICQQYTSAFSSMMIMIS
jgi:hypothetical protein